MFWGRKDEGPDLLPMLAADVVEAEAVEEAPPPPADDAEYVWRCRACGSMGTSRDSMLAHIAPGKRCEAESITEYIPRPPASTSQELSASGIWIVIKMDERAEEGERPGRYMRTERWSADVLEADTGLAAIQSWYSRQIGALRGDAKESDRNKANGRYVAIDFFTGHRAEALVTSEWRANVEVAAGSHA